MNKAQRGAEILTKELNRIGELTELRDYLDEAGGLVQVVAEAQSRVDGLKLQEEAAKERIANMGKEFSIAQSEAVASAKSVVDEALASAAAVRQAAEEDASKIREAAAIDAANAADKLLTINGDVSRARATLSGLNSDIAASEARLVDIKAELDALRRKVG